MANNNNRTCSTCSGTCKLNEKYGPDYACGAWRPLKQEGNGAGNKIKCPFLGALGECGASDEAGMKQKDVMCFEIEFCTLRDHPGASR